MTTTEQQGFKALFDKISKKQALVTVIGLGKMGLPLAAIISNYGYKVIGVDINQEVVDSVNRGESHVLNEPFVPEMVREGVKKGFLRATTDLSEAIPSSNVVIVLIPVLLDDEMNADYQALEKLYKPIAENLTPETLIIQESTVPPKTTRDVLLPILQQYSKLEFGKDFWLAHAPERTYSGRVVADIVDRYPKIVGGVDKESGLLAEALYKTFASKGVIRMSSALAAETVKVFEGVYRDVNIALANEFALLAEKLKINVLEVIEACNTQPFSHIHKPGIGVGGHCIPVYPHFLIQTAKHEGITTNLIFDARKMNLRMPFHALETIEKALQTYGLPMKWEEHDILVLGLAYRGGVKEHRNSPTLSIIPELKLNKKPRNIIVVDPLYTSEELKEILGVEGRSQIPQDYEPTIIIIATDHKEFKQWAQNLIPPKDRKLIIYDGRYIFEKPKENNLIILQPGQIPDSIN